MAQYEIIQMTVAHVPAIAQLLVESYKHDDPNAVSQEYITQHIQNYNELNFVAVTGVGEVVGLVFVTQMPKNLYLDQFVVSNQHQRQRVGRRLLETCINRARNIFLTMVQDQVAHFDFIYLWVPDSPVSAPAIHLYESLGFLEVQRKLVKKISAEDVSIKMVKRF